MKPAADLLVRGGDNDLYSRKLPIITYWNGIKWSF